MRWNSNFITRERIVSGSLCGSVVQRTKTTCFGGSSSVFSSALNAGPVIMCASSTMYVLCLKCAGAYCTRSRRSRISSIPRLLAASISITSGAAPLAISVQTSQSPQGSPSFAFGQFSALAKMRAMLVLPVPRGPEKRYACPTRPCFKLLRRICVTWRCPTTSAKFLGRYLRYKA